MSDLIVKRVETRREKKQFLTFPWTLYRDDPYWIPPLRMDQEELVGYRNNPFYARNLCQTFVAYRGAEVCGRIAAILNQGHNERYDERRGFFGFFECVDDQEVADGLFDAATDWFASQEIFAVRGPVNPSLNHVVGLLVDGFDSSPTFMMTYNPPYYERLIENYGFRKIEDLYAFWGHIDMLPKIQAKLAPIAEQIIEHYDVRLRPLDTSRFMQDVEAFLDIYNRSLVNTWGFVPMSGDEVRHMAKGLQYLIVPDMTVAAEIDGRMVGACFGLPDYNPRIKEIDGRLFPFGFLKLIRNKQKIKKVRVISTNVLPEFQLMGVGLTLMHGLVPRAMDWGLEEAEFSWVLESNSLSRGSLEKGGAKITKTYRLYDYDIPKPTRDDLAADQASATRPTALVRTGVPTSGAVEIREVKTRADKKRFFRVPWSIYAEDPQWVPPLAVEVDEFLNRRKHPFYRHGEATQFLAWRDGEAVGRVLVSCDPRYNERWQTKTGCFGMFESPNDCEVAHGLLDAAANWLRAQGMTDVLGPIDYSTNYPCGLLIDGFDTPPRVMMNHNRPFFAGLLESWGLTKVKDLYAWWFADQTERMDRWQRRVQRIAKRGKVTIRSFDMNDFSAEVERCRSVYNRSMQRHWGFVRLTDAEFHYLAKRLAQVAVPEMILLAEVDGEPVGFAATLPDVNEAIRPLDGRLTKFGLPINLARLLWRSRRIKTTRMLILDILEEHRRRGIAEMLILETFRYGKNEMGYTGAELGWTLEDNEAVNRTIESVGGRRYKTFRIFGKSLV